MLKLIDTMLLDMRIRSRHARLAELDDRLLADIGLDRGDLRSLRKRR